MSHTCHAAYAASRTWFRCVEVVLHSAYPHEFPPYEFADSLVLWLQSHDAEARIIARGLPGAFMLHPDATSLFRNLRIAELEVTTEGLGREKSVLLLDNFRFLPALRSLRADWCMLDGSLRELSHLRSLESLTLEFCDVDVVPHALLSLPLLTALNLSQNCPMESQRWRESFRHVMPRLTGLQDLDLTYTFVEQHISLLTPLAASLTRLNLNGLSRGVEYGHLSRLSALRSFTACDTLPLSLSSLHVLTYLNLEGNEGLHVVPEVLSTLTTLKVLDLEYTGMDSGTEDFWNLRPLKQLQYLRLCSNRLASISMNITALTALTHLDLSGNPLHSAADSWLHLMSLPLLKLLTVDINLYRRMHPRLYAHMGTGGRDICINSSFASETETETTSDANSDM